MPVRERKTRAGLPAGRLTRRVLFVMPVLFMLAWGPPGATEAVNPPHPAGHAVPAPAAGGAASPSPVSGQPGEGDRTGGKDLTVFFTIGAVINILLVAAFLVWAVGERAKTRK